MIHWVWLSAVVVILDQASKWWALEWLSDGDIVVFPVLNLSLAFNRGAAWGILNDAGGWQRWFFIVLAVVVSIIISYWLYKLPRNEKLSAVALSLILGGAFGNLLDRVFRDGAVVDFIQVHWERWYFPTFNVADSAITVGVILLIVDAIFFANKRQSASQSV